MLCCRGVGLNFFGYTPKLAQFADTVSRDVGDLAFWAAVPDSVIENSKDRLMRTFRSCEHASSMNISFRHISMR